MVQISLRALFVAHKEVKNYLRRWERAALLNPSSIIFLGSIYI